MITMLRKQLSDEQKVGWPDDAELMVYLDRAADALSERLIKAKDPTMLKKIHVEGTMDLPDDLVAFVGNVPVSVVGRQCESYGGAVDALYWARLPYPSLGGTYTRDKEASIIDIARIFALNRNEYDVSQDITLLSLGGSSNG